MAGPGQGIFHRKALVAPGRVGQIDEDLAKVARIESEDGRVDLGCFVKHGPKGHSKMHEVESRVDPTDWASS
jgi:hypothetical protein